MYVFSMIKQTKDPSNGWILDKLPKLEKIAYQLYFHERVKQTHIAKYMGVTQGAISHRLIKSMRRLRYVFLLPTLDTKEKAYARNALGSFVYDLCIFMAETTCQSIVAEKLNNKYHLPEGSRMNQVKVRFKFKRALNKLGIWSEQEPRLKAMYKLVSYVDQNIYMMHWVHLPQWNKRRLRFPNKITKEVVLNSIGKLS